MNIYKKENEILCSLNGCPEGWKNLGFDALVTEENKNFVTGFTNGKAVFDQQAIANSNQGKKDLLIERIKKEIFEFFQSETKAGVNFLTFNFQAREEDLVRMNLVISKVAIGGQFAGAWRDRNNKWQQLTIEQLKSLAITAGSFWEQCFQISRDLIDELPTLSIEVLANYNVGAKFRAKI